MHLYIWSLSLSQLRKSCGCFGYQKTLSFLLTITGTTTLRNLSLQFCRRSDTLSIFRSYENKDDPFKRMPYALFV